MTHKITKEGYLKAKQNLKTQNCSLKHDKFYVIDVKNSSKIVFSFSFTKAFFYLLECVIHTYYMNEISTNLTTPRNYPVHPLTFEYPLKQVLPPTKKTFIHICSRNPLLLNLLISHFFISFLKSVAYQNPLFWIKNSLLGELRQNSLTRKWSWNCNTIPYKI